jgi:hypothetical protein
LGRISQVEGIGRHQRAFLFPETEREREKGRVRERRKTGNSKWFSENGSMCTLSKVGLWYCLY